MKSQWLVWSSELSEEVCNDIIERGLRNNTTPGVIGTAGGAIDGDIRASFVSWFNKKTDTDIVSLINEYTNEANKTNFGVDISYGLNDIQFSSYPASHAGHYSWHKDTFHSSLTPNDRKLSICIQLSKPEEYEGGEFEFRGCDPLKQELFAPQGSILIFPSIFEHRVKPVTKGVRYSLVSWIEGPKWR